MRHTDTDTGTNMGMADMPLDDMGRPIDPATMARLHRLDLIGAICATIGLAVSIPTLAMLIGADVNLHPVATMLAWLAFILSIGGVLQWRTWWEER